jgi:leader peptidase (prepilin peptidase)/N-methyltransferase
VNTLALTSTLAAAALPCGWLAARLGRAYAGPSAPPRAPVILAMILAMILAFAWSAVDGPPGWPRLASLGLAWTLICLAAIDLEAFRLPDPLTLPLLAAGLAVSVALPGRPWVDHLAGAALGWAALWLIAAGYRRLRAAEGLGLGDAKLLGAGGAWLGWAALPSVLLLACAVAFAWVGVGVLRGGSASLRARIAFGPPLCLAIWIVWMRGPLPL